MFAILSNIQIVLINIFLVSIVFTLSLIIKQNNPVYAVFSFILTAFIAFLFLLYIGAEFFALLILIIYTGVITVLFLLVVLIYNLRYTKDVKTPKFFIDTNFIKTKNPGSKRGFSTASNSQRGANNQSDTDKRLFDEFQTRVYRKNLYLLVTIVISVLVTIGISFQYFEFAVHDEWWAFTDIMFRGGNIGAKWKSLIIFIIIWFPYFIVQIRLNSFNVLNFPRTATPYQFIKVFIVNFRTVFLCAVTIYSFMFCVTAIIAAIDNISIDEKADSVNASLYLHLPSVIGGFLHIVDDVSFIFIALPVYGLFFSYTRPKIINDIKFCGTRANISPEILHQYSKLLDRTIIVAIITFLSNIFLFLGIINQYYKYIIFKKWWIFPTLVFNSAVSTETILLIIIIITNFPLLWAWFTYTDFVAQAFPETISVLGILKTLCLIFKPILFYALSIYAQMFFISGLIEKTNTLTNTLRDLFLDEGAGFFQFFQFALYAFNENFGFIISINSPGTVIIKVLVILIIFCLFFSSTKGRKS